jgi:hypothetical protein
MLPGGAGPRTPAGKSPADRDKTLLACYGTVIDRILVDWPMVHILTVYGHTDRLLELRSKTSLCLCSSCSGKQVRDGPATKDPKAFIEAKR